MHGVGRASRERPQRGRDGPVAGAAEERGGQVARRGEHLRGRATAELRAIFIPDYIAHPVRAVLDPPMGAAASWGAAACWGRRFVIA